MKRFSNILLVIDTDADYTVALQRAVDLAQNNQATLTVSLVIDATQAHTGILAVTPDGFSDFVVGEKSKMLRAMVSTIADRGMTIQTKVLVGRAYIEIIRQVIAAGHDLLIKNANEDDSLASSLFRSTDMRLMRKCPCPVWIIRANEQRRYQRILAAVDLDPEEAVKDSLNRKILELSTSLALSEFCELHVVHAWRLQAETYFRSPRAAFSDADVDAMAAEEFEARQQWLEDLLKAYGAKANKGALDYLEPKLHLVKGDAKLAVPAKVRELDADLVVMGTVARTGIAGFFMGNTAESILTQIDCSVLTVKPAGFETPVTMTE